MYTHSINGYRKNDKSNILRVAIRDFRTDSLNTAKSWFNKVIKKYFSDAKKVSDTSSVGYHFEDEQWIFELE